MENPLKGKLCEILVLRLVLVTCFGIDVVSFSQMRKFPRETNLEPINNPLYSQIVSCKKFSVMGESPAIFFVLGIWENNFFHLLEAFVSLRWQVF